MAADITISIASSVDAQAIAGVILEAFAPFEKFYTPGAFAATTPAAAQIRECFAEAGAIWVAWQDDRIVGTVSAVDEGERLYVRSMAVSPLAQGCGVGRRLLETVEKHAIEHGFSRLFLYTTPFLAGAIRLYELNGFVQSDAGDFFGTPLLAMEKWLEQRDQNADGKH